MRKVQKDSIIELTNLLKKAQEHVKNLLIQQEYASVLDLLQQCQQVAIQIGTIIEQSEGEGFPTVKKLEEYCEFIFQLFNAVQNGISYEVDILEKTETLLAEIEEEIRSDIRIRKEMVFLPYKASMWDSLESIWMAADADPECDAYVVPIPYFDKNPDGTAKEMHYEGDLFPEYVPITHYENYDIVKRHPDAIYIHNPYDEANFVTSVHPAFYANRLKELTDCLIYIPYFVLAEVNPNDKEMLKAIEHFVTVPGVIHAHKVVVQSEAMRQAYINVISSLTGENTRYYWEEKILGIGSPKFDKVHNTSRDNLKIPDEWKKNIEKPDGQWKKIIFYNTSVTALLENNEKMLEKIRDVFAAFKEKKEEVVLLWRPHPLIKATIESMRPKLWQEYQKLVEEYKKEGWGIYDDTSDMDRAVVLCDGYYGDPSSVLQLCREAGKPVMVQRCNVLRNEKKALKFETVAEYGGRCYAVNMEANGLYIINTDAKAEFVGMFPKEKCFQRFLYCACIESDNKLFFVPEAADHIAVYDIKKGVFDAIDFESDVVCEGYDKNCKFANGIIYNGYIYFFPQTYPGIMKMSLSTQKIEYINAWAHNKKYKVRKSFDYSNGIVTMVSSGMNYILEFSLENEKIRLKKIRDDIEPMGICKKDNIYWITDNVSASFLKLNSKGEVTGKVSVNPNKKAGDKSFSAQICCEEDIYVLPCSDKNIYIWIAENEKFERVDLTDVLHEPFVSYVGKLQKYLLFLSRSSDLWNCKGKYIFFDIEKKESRNCTIYSEDSSELDVCMEKGTYEFYETIIENACCGIDEFMKMTVLRRENIRNRTMCGNDIYNDWRLNKKCE